MAESSFPSPRRRVGIPALIAVVAFLLGIAAVDALSKGQDTATRVDPSEVASADVLLPPEGAGSAKRSTSTTCFGRNSRRVFASIAGSAASNAHS